MRKKIKKALALVDGEHYLPVTLSTIEHLSKKYNYKFVGAVFIGGMEKIGSKADLKGLNMPLFSKKDSKSELKKAIRNLKPDVVTDLSDEPVVTFKERFEFANIILNEGVTYSGADFVLEPPVFHDLVKKPSISIIGNAKRVGKTAIGSYCARLLKEKFNPCILTMGRGGPLRPEIIDGSKIEMTPEYFLKQADLGRHAASDHFEDALFSRLPVVGCRRCGGGMAGVVLNSVVPEGAEIANELNCNFIIFEGSGPTIPPVKTDTWIITVGANKPIQYINDYLNPFRIMKSSLAILTMCEEPMADEKKIRKVIKELKKINPKIETIKTVFRPKPLRKIEGKKIVFATTAPKKANKILKRYIQEKFSCKIAGISNNLSNRKLLKRDINKIKSQKKVDTLLTEVKAASIDVAVRLGMKSKLNIIFVDNIPISIERKNLDNMILKVARRAKRKFYRRS